MNEPPNDNSPKLVELQQPRNEIAAAGEHVRRNFDALLANTEMVARLRRATFLAYVKAGFTEQQALELCCK